MKSSMLLRFILLGCAAVCAVLPPSALACATCFGKNDSKLAEGMNMGIFSLLAVVVCVLGAIASFFIYLAKRSSALAAAPQPGTLAEPTH